MHEHHQSQPLLTIQLIRQLKPPKWYLKLTLISIKTRWSTTKTTKTRIKTKIQAKSTGTRLGFTHFAWRKIGESDVWYLRGVWGWLVDALVARGWLTGGWMVAAIVGHGVWEIKGRDMCVLSCLVRNESTYLASI